MGIKFEQFDIFKINLTWLEQSDWDLKISRKEALSKKALVSLFDSQMFQHIRDILTDRNIKLPKTDYSQYVLSLVNDTKSKTRFKNATKGFKVNGITFKRFVGTTGGLKANTVLFVNADIIDELNAKCECGRNKALKVVPAKYEAYKALTCSASQKICNPKGILVVKDNLINIKADVIYVRENEDDKDSEPIVDERTIDIENNNSDGFNLCTYDYMKRVSESLGIDYVTTGVCLRNAYCKGMMYAFPIVEFCEKYLHDYYVTDIWGHKVDIRTIDLILTESSLKFWDSYSSSEDYIKQYISHGYSFRVTKVIGKKLEDTRELNYQYLQDYNLTDEDIIELCEPTLKAIKSNTCGDYDSVLKYLGISKTKTPKMAWQQALLYDESLMYDNFIVSKIKRMIRKKMDEAKIGKLICNGNFQQLSGDAFGLMQSICGLPVTGLLKANECYSSYWQNEELVVFRSPMIGHNNICKLHNTINADTQYWYKYMGNVFILNGFDTTCTALSGADMDNLNLSM
jgi:hypothetical protein